jgi:hypothetical protein
MDVLGNIGVRQGVRVSINWQNVVLGDAVSVKPTILELYQR